MKDKRFILQSIFLLSDPLHAPYTCVVYNGAGEEEGRVEIMVDVKSHEPLKMCTYIIRPTIFLIK